MLSPFTLFGFTLLCVLGLWVVFLKANKPGWAAIIPIYNAMVLCDVIGKPRIWVILLLIPGINLIFSIWMINLLSKSFGKDWVFTVGILLVPFLFLLILGLGSSKYLGPVGMGIQNDIDRIGNYQK